MAQTKWSDVYGADQLLTGARFTVEFFGVPSAIVDTGLLKLYGKASQLPDQTVEVAEGRIGNIPVNQPDGLAAPGDWTFTVLENAGGKIHPMLSDWKEYVMGSESGNATRGYNTTKAVQTIYNHYGEVARVIDIFNVYPVTVPQIQPDSSATGNIVEYAVVFKLSRHKDRETILR